MNMRLPLLAGLVILALNPAAAVVNRVKQACAP